MSNQQKRVSPGSVAVMLLIVFGLPFLPLLITSRWDWWEAWLYAGISIVGFVVSRRLAARRNPGLLTERARFLRMPDAQPFDKVLAPLVGVGGGLLPLVAGVEARLDTSPGFSLALKGLALALILAGYVLASYALVANQFFSGMVRLQTDRGHHVVSSGPYRWIRHPGYAGAMITYLPTAILLDSTWAFVPATLIVIILIIRTGLEDQFLQAELDGYRAYAARVHHRLLPGVW